MPDHKIVRAAIHPGIGVARVGNSEQEFFIGPEVPRATPRPPGFYKDASGALKRQAAKFRVFGYNAAGEVVAELNADNARIRWTVYVANRKSAWYNFELALDIPGAIPCQRRNANFVGGDRRQLEIDPGPRSIEGKEQHGAKFDTGRFCGEEVYLGELQTDEKGNLLFLGGHGVSGTPFPNNPATSFGNNNGWHDDISDGPVEAEVTIDGTNIPVDPAWVVTAPPNYAPDLISIVTMYDVLYDTYAGNWIQPPSEPSFIENILPLLEQFCEAQWVNYGFYVQFGWRAPNEFLRQDYLKTLASKEKKEYEEFRRQVFYQFRNPDFQQVQTQAWPWMYGDHVKLNNPPPRGFFAVTNTQYSFLQQWVNGNFKADLKHLKPLPEKIEEVPLELRPATLDKAALYFCLGGPFHPGCEMTWPMRTATMYYAPFRIRPRGKNDPEPDYGEWLTAQVATSDNGPLYANGPGDISRWMAVPWQTDTASCRAGYDPAYDPYLPTFWPVHVPNHVLTLANYEKAIDASLPREERLAAFNSRATWYRGLKGQYLDQINEMVTEFGKLGVVERRDGVKDDPDFPPVMFVESKPEFDEDVPDDRNTIVGAVEKVTRHQST